MSRESLTSHIIPINPIIPMTNDPFLQPPSSA